MDIKRLYGGAAAAVLSVALAVGLGCGSDKSDKPTGELEGAVTLDDQPIVTGSIDFFPAQKGQAPPVNAKIVDGRYKVEGVPIGKVVAKITAMKETGEEVAIPHSDEKYKATVNLIPLKYAKGIDLDVAEGKATYDFKLTSTK